MGTVGIRQAEEGVHSAPNYSPFTPFLTFLGVESVQQLILATAYI